MQVAPSQTLFQAISHLGSGNRAVSAPARQIDAAGQNDRHASPATQPPKVLQQAHDPRETNPDAPIRRGMFVDIRV